MAKNCLHGEKSKECFLFVCVFLFMDVQTLLDCLYHFNEKLGVKGFVYMDLFGLVRF